MRFTKPVLSTVLPIALLLSGSALSAQAQSIFGLNKGDAGGGIYQINSATGASTLIYSTPALNASVDGNALAYDIAGGNFYYLGANDNLYRRNGTGETLLGTLTGSISDATFYNGSYYYVRDNTNALHTVTFSGNAIASDTSINMTGVRATGYGDIAFDPNGLLYGASAGQFYKYDLATDTATILNTTLGNLQLGFSGDTLYGVATNTDAVYRLNTMTGAANFVSTLSPSSLTIQDAASSVPEPGSLALLAGLGISGSVFARRRKQARQAA